jgi:hypothetical protein
MKAFPNNRSEGMDLRDYFAAQAMQSILTIDHYDFTDYLNELSAKAAYKVADAMMKAREKNGQGN